LINSDGKVAGCLVSVVAKEFAKMAGPVKLQKRGMGKKRRGRMRNNFAATNKRSKK